MVLKEIKTAFGFLLLFLIKTVLADSNGDCSSAGITTLVVVLFVIVIILIGVAVYFWKKSKPKSDHLILETDPERGKSDYALDNPGFVDPCGTPLSKYFDTNSKKKLSISDKSNIRLPQLATFTTKCEQKQTVDDSMIDDNDVIVVSLRSQDFAGLGFNICGNMKEGIFIKDILQRGPASESGKLTPGDRIKSVKINFDNIVYEDALNILSYASPYEVTIEASKSKIQLGTYTNNNYPNHPIFRSSSQTNIQQVDQTPIMANNINTVTLEQEVMKSFDKKQLETEIDNMELQKSEYDHQKSENGPILTDIDAVPFERNDSFRGSGLKRDSNGIPQEIPSHMLNAAVAARRNRKSSLNDEQTKSHKKNKGKAPPPPPELNDDISSLRKEYSSDSDEGVENHSSVNTIELNSSDITIHQGEDDENVRKTASTGDLTKIDKANKLNSVGLGRAQSLDITDDGDHDLKLDKEILDKEPRLTFILDSLNTFQRKRLKKSTEWGNLEDAILRSNPSNDFHSISSDLDERVPELDALVNKIDELRRESIDEQVKNEIWPSELDKPVVIETKLPENKTTLKSEMKISEIPTNNKLMNRNNIWPIELEQNSEEIPIEQVKDEHESQNGLTEERIPMKVLVNDSRVEDASNNEKDVTLMLVSEDVKPNESVDFSSEMKIYRRQQIPTEKHELILPPEQEHLDETEEISAISAAANHFETDETTLNNYNIDTVSATEILIKNEREFYGSNETSEDTNISDDIKVSRHSLGTLETPKSDDAKSIESLKYSSNVTITNCQDNGLHSLEFSVNDASEEASSDSELYRTALNNTVTITTPDLIKNITLAEAINASEDSGGHSVTVTNGTFENDDLNSSSIKEDISDSTYITEIQVTPNNSLHPLENINNKFENYLKNIQVNHEDNSELQNEKNSEISSNIDPEKELLKIQEIAQEQLKKLPEMRFSTRSYENPSREKSQSQIEILRSNFEKTSPIKSPKSDSGTKSRIPISTTMKVAPSSPEISEQPSSFTHSTPTKYQKNSNKNITITSIKNNSKIPSGLSVGKPQIPSRKFDHNDTISDNNSNSFKQWVFESNTTRSDSEYK